MPTTVSRGAPFVHTDLFKGQQQKEIPISKDSTSYGSEMARLLRPREQKVMDEVGNRLRGRIPVDELKSQLARKSARAHRQSHQLLHSLLK